MHCFCGFPNSHFCMPVSICGPCRYAIGCLEFQFSDGPVLNLCTAKIPSLQLALVGLKIFRSIFNATRQNIQLAAELCQNLSCIVEMRARVFPHHSVLTSNLQVKCYDETVEKPLRNLVSAVELVTHFCQPETELFALKRHRKP